MSMRYRNGQGLFIDYPSEAIIDEETGERYYDGVKPNYVSSKEVCKLLNNLTNDNEQLKQKNRELQGKASSWKITAGEEMMRQSELVKENVKLKQYKQSVKDILTDWSNKDLTAHELGIVIAIMKELNVMEW